jgi:trimethylamine--corrinoid protein Co-methyltransferase|tara:strand:+ start:1344 stop:2927 length:1584 start_codon:yes stop_codon:yes gene_type:complete
LILRQNILVVNMNLISIPIATSGRRGGRAQRIASRAASQANSSCPSHRRIPVYDLLAPHELQVLQDQCDWLLEDIGVEFIDDAESIDLFRRAGASVSGTRVRFKSGMLMEICASAPKSFKLHGRDPSHTVTVGGDQLVFTPAYGSPFVTDLDAGRRYARLEDFENFVKLAYHTPYLHHSGGTVCEPMDVAVNKRHLDMVYAHLAYSTKPFMGAVTAPDRAEDSVAMARIVFGEEFMKNHCVMQGNINVNSPLCFDQTMTSALKVYARAGQGIVLSPFILGGAMGPVTMPALVAQAHAEALVGIALSQLVQEGAPVVYGNFLSTMNLKTGAPTFGTPEANLAALAIGQLCRGMGLPLRCGGHLTAAKSADGQAMQESADSMTAGLMAGANYVLHAAGWLEGGLTMGYEKFVMDLDRCGMMLRFSQGLNLDTNNLAKDAYCEAGPGQNFFGVQHTLANFEKANYMSTLADTQSFESWSEAGSLTLEQRANGRWKAMLADYKKPALDPRIDSALKDFMKQRKQAQPDQWY